MIKKTFLVAVIALAAWMVPSVVEANSLQISNGELADQNTVSKTVAIEFDMSWSNSWKDGENHDASWIFVKYSTDSGDTWSHATMALSGVNPNGFSEGQGTSMDLKVPADLKGCFIYRAGSGVGSVSATDVRLLWDYGVDGLGDDEVASDIMVKVFALEMVHVPQGAFFAGDGATSTASFREGSSDTDPWFINNVGNIVVSNVAADGFYYVNGGSVGEDASGAAFTVPATFPNGFASFYMMKYEVTEGQWVSFFNVLTSAQKTARDITSAGGKNTDAVFKRNSVSWTSGNAVSDRQDRSMNYLSWADGVAFADWAGLRPMTELEFEKAGRGVGVATVAGGYPWGNTTITAATSIAGAEGGSETVSNSGANANFNNTTFSGGDGGSGLLRAGIFATGSSNRVVAGAGYYGTLDMAGNAVERVVTVGNATGRAFSGSHGDGELSAAGNATNTDWPGFDGSEVTQAAGSGMRGGSWSDASDRLRLSDRQEAAEVMASRHSRYGFRAVRTSN